MKIRVAKSTWLGLSLLACSHAPTTGPRPLDESELYGRSEAQSVDEIATESTPRLPASRLEWRPMPIELRHLSRPGLEWRSSPTHAYSAEFRAPVLGLKKSVEAELPKLLAKDVTVASLTPTQRECFNALLSGASSCDKTLPAPSALARHRGDGPRDLDLLVYGRELAQAQGMARARDALAQLIPAQGDDDGAFESAMASAARDPAFRVPNSVADLPMEKRARIGFFFAYGIGHAKLKAPKLIRSAALRLEAQGFKIHLFDTLSAGSSDENGRMIADQLDEKLDQLDAVVLVTASKGTQDFVYALTKHAHRIRPDRFAKLRVVTSLSGVVRMSQFARWMMGSPERKAKFTRWLAINPVYSVFESLDGVRSLAQDPWDFVTEEQVRSLREKLTWINFVMLPDTPEGWPTMTSFMEFMKTSIYKELPATGPYDMLVESAASMLPPGTGIRQWIVRAEGSHGLVNGKFLDGTPASAVFAREGAKANLEAAVEVMETFLRAMPRTILD